MKRLSSVCLAFSVVVAIFATTPAFAQTLAFPGALGFGANATGGRNGTVYHVTTLADSGAGSFRTAVSSPNRIVVFDVGGYISLLSAVSVRENITIAGQTAPGGGIGFRGGEISFANRSNIICRYIRIRPGSDTASSTDAALSLYRARNVILDHVSLEFAPWDNVDAVSDDWQNWPVTDVTFQNCLDANPTGQQFAAHTESVSSTMSWIYCAFVNSRSRNPMAKINNVFINNVVYNCSAGYTTHTSTSFDHDVVNNYFIVGPAGYDSQSLPWYQVDNNQSIYYSGNLFDADRNGALNGSITTPYWYQGGSGGTVLASPWSALTTNIPTYSPTSAFRVAVSQAGALPRDPLDDLVIGHMRTIGNGSTGPGAGTAGPSSSYYSSQTETGLGNNGYGTINGGVGPLDADADGMPDYWEQANGSNLGGNDAMTIGADGYAKIEKYINWLADPHALTTTNAPMLVDLWQWTSGFTNASSVYSVTGATNGSVTISNGHFAVFTPASGFSGLGSFRFSVTGSDGTAYTNTVTVVMSALQPPSNLTWRGDGSANVWSTTASNWVGSGGALVVFNTGDNVTFDDTGSNSPAINLSSSLAAGTVYVLADQPYTFGGSGYLAGSTTLFKTGNGTLFLNTANTFTGGTTINDGVVQVGDGATINGNLGGNITNNDTLIFANPTALSSSASISGSGELIKNGAGTLTVTGNQSFTNRTTINAGTLELTGLPPQGGITNRGVLTYKPSSLVTNPGVISGPGSVVVNNSSGTVYLTGTNTYTGGTTNLGGNLIFANSYAAGTGPVIYNAASGSVMVGGGAVITNDFTVGGSSFTDLMMQGTNGTGTWAGSLVNLGSSAQFRPGADTGGTLVFTGTAALGSRFLIVPRGSVQFASNAVVTTTQTGCAIGRDGSGGNRSASVTFKDNASVTLGGCNLGGNMAGGNVTVTIQNSAALNIGTSSLDINNVNRTTAQTFLRLNGGTFTVGGFTKTKTPQTNVIQFNSGVLKAGAANASFLPSFSVSSNWVQAGGARIDDGGFAITIAAPLIHDPALGATADGGLTKLGAGTLTLTAINTYTGPTVVSNGTLLVNYAASFASGTGTGAVTVSSGATLGGFGFVGGQATVNSGGTLSPGTSAGTLTVSNLVLNAGSLSRFELGTISDKVVVGGNLVLGGTLSVTNLAGFDTNTYTLFTYGGSLSGVIPAIGSMPGGYVGTIVTNTPGQVNLVVQLPPATPPSFSSLSVSAGNLAMSGSNGSPGGNYYALFATNISTPLSNWIRLATNQFDANGGFAFTNAIDPNAAQKFFRLQVL